MESRLAESVKEEYMYGTNKTYFWIEPKVVLYWLRSQSHGYKSFVAHPIGEIHERLDVKDCALDFDEVKYCR